MQSVGQNKHLKLRLQKGHTSFDGIFFSVTPAECGLTVGERVDAAFYLQVNEFRGSRSLRSSSSICAARTTPAPARPSSLSCAAR